MTTITDFADLKTAMTEQLEKALAAGKPIDKEEAEARALEQFWAENKPFHSIRQDTIDEWLTATHHLADALYWDPMFGHTERDGEEVHLSTLGMNGASHFFLNKIHWSLGAQRKFWENKLSENTEIMKRHLESEDGTEIWLQKSERIANYGEFCESQCTFWQQLEDQIASVYMTVHDKPIEGTGRRGKPADSADAKAAVAATVANMNAILARRAQRTG